MSLEMAHKVIVPPKKNYIPQFLKQRDINSYFRIGEYSFGEGKNAGQQAKKGELTSVMEASSIST